MSVDNGHSLEMPMISRHRFMDLMAKVFHLTFKDINESALEGAGNAIILDGFDNDLLGTNEFDLSIIDMLIICRLRLPENDLIKRFTPNTAIGARSRLCSTGITYIFGCYRNLCRYSGAAELGQSQIETLKRTLINFGRSWLEDREGVLMGNGEAHPTGRMGSFKKILTSSPQIDIAKAYFKEVFSNIEDSVMDQIVEEILEQSIQDAKEDQMPGSRSNFELNWISFCFENFPAFARAFIDSQFASLQTQEQIEIERTQPWIVAMMSKSFLPSETHKQFLLTHEIEAIAADGTANDFPTVQATWMVMAEFMKKFSVFIRQTLKQPSQRPKFIRWLASAAAILSERAKTQNMMNVANRIHMIGDGFLLNLTILSLIFAMPVINRKNTDMIDKHYPTCKHTVMYALFNQCQFLHTSCNTQHPDHGVCNCAQTESQYNFSTEILYITHYIVNVFYTRVVGLHRLFRRGQEATEAYLDDAIANPDSNAGIFLERLQESVNQGNYAIANLIVILMFTEISQPVFEMLAFTSRVYANPKLSTKLDSQTKSSQCIPEFVIDNFNQRIKCYFFNPIMGSVDSATCAGFNPALVPDILNFVVDLMSNKTDIRNPHIRAAFADSLSCLSRASSTRLTFSRVQTKSMLDAIMNTFVLIEVSEQTVEFEEKYPYRLSLHEVMQSFLEIIPANRGFIETFEFTCEQAIDFLDNGGVISEDDDMPMLIRFFNLLLNDATFLLDDAFDLVNKIREQEAALGDDADGDSNVARMYDQCRYRLMLGTNTLKTIYVISQVNQSFLAHKSNAPRLAAMINFFLNKLCGPDRNNLRIAKMDRILFTPKNIVNYAASIHINLKSQPEYIKAISRDLIERHGREHPEFLKNTLEIVIKISGAHESFANHFREVVKAVENCMSEDETEDYEDIPEAFIDPITTELMLDPVRLPSSNVVIDRSTITRHLLSDQTDPFNRQPLKIQDLIPEPEIKKVIEEWKKNQDEEIARRKLKKSEKENEDDDQTPSL